MKNSFGRPATDDNFYHRGSEIKKIYRVLESGACIYLSAPRRVGKTSILKYLQDKPAEGYDFVYVITESIYEENDFFKEIFEELLKSNAVKKIAKASNTLRQTIDSVIGKVSSIQGVELRENKTTNYFDLLVELLSSIKEESARVVIMIDEFPQTIQNILDKSDAATAQKFIQQNRTLRHNSAFLNKISLIYTGSTSLFFIVDKITSLNAINDLRTIEVNPLSKTEAQEFIALLLKNEGVVLREELLEYTIEKIRWLIPFHLQLIQQEIIDVYETTGKEIDKKTIDMAFEQIVHSRNRPQFAPYFSRLKKLFKHNEYNFAIRLLTIVAKKDILDINELHDLAVKYEVTDYKTTLIMLQDDGYLINVDNSLCFISPILQLWCKKHLAE